MNQFAFINLYLAGDSENTSKLYDTLVEGNKKFVIVAQNLKVLYEVYTKGCPKKILAVLDFYNRVSDNIYYSQEDRMFYYLEESIKFFDYIKNVANIFGLNCDKEDFLCKALEGKND